MRSSRPALAAAATLSLALLAGCGTSGSPSGGATTSAPASVALKGVTATGPVDFKTAPKVSLGKTPISSTAIERKVLAPGTGPAATANSSVKVFTTVYNGTDGKQLDNGYEQGRTALGVWLSSKNIIPGLTKGLVGAQAGSRVVFTVPPKDGFGAQGNEQLGVKGTDTLVLVSDVQSVTPVLTSIEGTQTAVPAGLPTVEFTSGSAKEPTVVMPKTAPPTETQQATLIEGKGAAVEKGQTLIAQYHGLLWKDGSVFDSSWQRGSAADFPIGSGQVIPGWDKTLVGKKVGSRVLLVIPPKDGYGTAGSPPKIAGTDTLVFVVDILGTA